MAKQEHSKSIKFIIGRLKGDTSTTVESVLFRRLFWTPAMAKAWLKREGFKVSEMDEGGPRAVNLRFRQRDPSEFTRGSLRTIPASRHQRQSNPDKIALGDDSDAAELTDDQLRELTRAHEYQSMTLAGRRIMFDRATLNRERDRRKHGGSYTDRSTSAQTATRLRRALNTERPDVTWNVRSRVDAFGNAHYTVKWVNGPSEDVVGEIAELLGIPRQRTTLLRSGRAAKVLTMQRQRNPSIAADDAANLYEAFTGKPARHSDEYRNPPLMPRDQALLGPLVELRIHRGATITVPDSAIGDILLTSNAAGTQLYIVGTIDLPSSLLSGHAGKEWLDLGECSRVVYRCQKEFDNFRTYDYDHRLGEEGGERPILTYNTRTRTLTFVGGDYAVKPEGIRN